MLFAFITAAESKLSIKVVQFTIDSKLHYYLIVTDGCRVLCHQFSTSSLPHLGNCIKRYRTLLQRMERLMEAIPLL